MRSIVSFAVACAACSAPPEPARVLVYTRTLGYRHADAIAIGAQRVPDLLAVDHLTTDVTEDPAAFTAPNLARYRAVVFLYTSGNDVIDADGKVALEAFVRGGGGWLGIHSAADTEYLWPFYQQLVVAPFQNHPVIQPATIDLAMPTHPALRDVPAGRWLATDEWYNFQRDPSAVAGVRVLATIDETSYQGGTMGPSHPMIWCREDLGGRALYSELGHVAERWQEPAFVALVTGAVRWVARVD